MKGYHSGDGGHALDRARGETGDVVVEEEDVDDHDRDAREQRPRHERAPEVDVAADQVRGDAHHGGLVRRLRDEGERVGELVPAEREAEEHGADDPGDGHRQHDLRQRLHARRPVHEGALLDLARDGPEVAHEEPGAERHQEGRVDDHERVDRVGEPEPHHDLREREEEQGGRDEVGDEDGGAEGGGAAEAQPRQAVAGQDRDDHGDRRRHDGDEQAVLHPGDEVGLLEEERVVIHDHAALDPEGDGLEVVQLGVRLEGRHDHEIEGEEHEEHVGRQVRVREHVRPDAGAAAPGRGHGYSFLHVAELEEHHHRQEGEDEEGDRRALAEVAALEADLVGEGGEEMGRVDRAPAGQHLDDVEVAEGEDRREENDHARAPA